MKRILLAISLLLCVACLAACPADDGVFHMDVSEDGRFVCRESGVAYREAPSNYLPRTMRTTAYARQETAGAARWFYPCGEDSAAQYLVCADPDDRFPYFMLMAEEYTMPSLAAMAPTTMAVCGSTNEFYWYNVYDRSTNLGQIGSLVTLYETGESCSLPAGNVETLVYLVFYSDDYPEFGYTCKYIVLENGDAFLADPEGGRTVRANPALLAGLRLTA